MEKVSFEARIGILNRVCKAELPEPQSTRGDTAGSMNRGATPDGPFDTADGANVTHRCAGMPVARYRARMHHDLAMAGGGFLLAVLWFDLMFDVLVLRPAPPGHDDEARVDQLAAYYRRVTLDAAPMGNLVGLVMLGTAYAALRLAWAEDRLARWAAVVALCVPVALAGMRILPLARRLATSEAPLEARRAMALGIGRGHVLCFAAIGAFLALTALG